MHKSSIEIPYKVLLLNPPVFDFYFTPARKEPLGLFYIARSLDGVPGIRAEFYDALYANRKKAVALPPAFDYLREFYQEDYSYFSLFHRYYRFGDSFAKIITRINQGGFHLVAISALYSAYFPDVEDLIAAIKRDTGALVAVGGWAVWSEGERLFRESRADYFIIDDEERAFPQLVRNLKCGDGERPISGVLSKYGMMMTPHETPAPPDHALFLNHYPRRLQPYTFRGKKIARMVLSRGCRHRCAFCSIHGRYPFISRPLDSIEAELEYLHAAGYEIVDFEDDNLFHDSAFTAGLLSLLERFRDRGMFFTAMNGITAVNLAPVVERAIAAGFIEFNVSLVTSDPATMRDLRRPLFYRAIETIAHASAGQVPVLAFVIAGLPGSNRQSVIDDIMALARLPVSIGFSPLYMLPNIPLFQTMGLPEDRRLLRGSALHRFGEDFTRTDIVSLWKWVRMINRIKSLSGALTDTDQENIDHFNRSIREKNWYFKRKNGNWESGLPFTLELPERIEIMPFTGHRTW